MTLRFGEPVDFVERIMRDLQADLLAQEGETIYGLPVRTSTLIPPDTVFVVGRDVVEADLKTGLIRHFPRIALHNPRDRAGYISRTQRVVHPCPLYTSRTLGAREAARDWRRQRRR